MRIVHYLNQFFGGIGGEEKAGIPLETRPGAVGPGRLLEQVMKDGSTVVLTIICGDNYAAEHMDEVTAQVIDKVREAKADLFVAGPCYDAGRYGVAAGGFSTAVHAKLGIPVITGMATENPGADLHQAQMHIIDSGMNVAKMADVVGKMAQLAKKLANKEAIGSPAAEGYIPQGILHTELVEQPAAVRLIKMALAKFHEEPYEADLRQATFAPFQAPPPVRDLKKAKIALVTDGGLVPKGNPDKIPSQASPIWGSYSIDGKKGLEGGDYEIANGGYDPRYILADPDRLVPVDIMREMEQKGVIGELHNEYLATGGLVNPLANSRRMGREMAKRLKEQGVDAVILTST